MAAFSGSGPSDRYLGVDAGPFRLALPLAAVRQILDLGVGEAPLDARALGVTPHSLARLLGATPTSTKPAMLLFDGHIGPVVLTCCALRGVFDASTPAPLPTTVACLWPGLLGGTVEDPGASLDRNAASPDPQPGLHREAPLRPVGADPGPKGLDRATHPRQIADGGGSSSAALRLVLDARVLMGLVEADPGEDLVVL